MTNPQNILKQKIILASTSPRRQDLLREAGYSFTVISPDAEEPPPQPGQDPAEYACSNSLLKAESVNINSQGFILAADTVVALDQTIYGKPVDEADARKIISTLMGTTHQVITGMTLINSSIHQTHTRHAVTHVTMSPLSSKELDDYLQSGMWKGKAGAYGVQDRADRYITHMDGSYSNVVGLPLELLSEMLSSWDDSPLG